MRVIQTAHKHAVGKEWSELAGPFRTLAQAEQYVEHPPEELGDPGTVTIDRDWGTRRDGGTGCWFVYALEDVKTEREAA